VLLKATKVAGVYDSDPKKNATASLYDTVSFDKVLTDKLNVMDATAVVMCRDNHLPLRVFDMTEQYSLVRAMTDENVGTLVTA
jgi:uridylate kinase